MTEQRQTYLPAEIEPNWQRFLERRQVFRAINPGESGLVEVRPKFYVLDVLPYPTGAFDQGRRTDRWADRERVGYRGDSR